MPHWRWPSTSPAAVRTSCSRMSKHLWDNAINSPINADDVGVGLRAARREVDGGIYRSRWVRATTAQRDLMRALADLAGDGAATVSALAFRMRRSRASDLSVARNELRKRAWSTPPERGMLAFTVPGMHEFGPRQANKEATRHTLTRPRAPHFLNAVADYDDQYRRLNRVTRPDTPRSTFTNRAAAPSPETYHSFRRWSVPSCWQAD